MYYLILLKIDMNHICSDNQNIFILNLHLLYIPTFNDTILL